MHSTSRRRCLAGGADSAAGLARRLGQPARRAPRGDASGRVSTPGPASVFRRPVSERMDGMFALAMYDEKTGDFYASRDEMGKAPMYWGKDEVGGELEGGLTSRPRSRFPCSSAAAPPSRRRVRCGWRRR